MYKIDTGRSVRVRSGVSASFKIFALTAEGNVLGGEGSCPGGNYPGKYTSAGRTRPGECPTPVGPPDRIRRKPKFLTFQSEHILSIHVLDMDVGLMEGMLVF